MRIQGYVLGVVLLAVVGWCMVQETIAQTQARYRLADLSRREEEVRKRLEKLQAKEESLRSPARLAMLVREKKMNLVALGSVQPESPSWASMQRETGRRPGEVLDADFTASRIQEVEEVNLARMEW